MEKHAHVAAIVLAAGASSRFGAFKQLLPWGEGTMLSTVVDTALASSARPVVVVLGNRADDCRAALGERPLTVVVNAAWPDGQSTSVQAGLAALPDEVQATLFLLADQPAVTVATLEAVIARYRATRAPVVWPEVDGRRGNPVLFDRRLFPALLALTGDTGGRPVLQANAAAAERVAVLDRGILYDVDTPDDYPTNATPATPRA
jgi:molybdenum cofactor cytidylyltransferase